MWDASGAWLLRGCSLIGGACVQIKRAGVSPFDRFPEKRAFGNRAVWISGVKTGKIYCPSGGEAYSVCQGDAINECLCDRELNHWHDAPFPTSATPARGFKPRGRFFLRKRQRGIKAEVGIRPRGQQVRKLSLHLLPHSVFNHFNALVLDTFMLFPNHVSTHPAGDGEGAKIDNR